MAVELSGPPTPVQSPAFAGLTLRVPLSEEPTWVWLDMLALQDLPGKGHRLSGAAVEFHLDRGARDVMGAMDQIAEAIAKTNQEYGARQEELESRAAAPDARKAAYAAKVAGQMTEWWSGYMTKHGAPAQLTAASDTESPSST